MDIEKCCLTRYPSAVLAERAKPIEKIDDGIRKLEQQDPLNAALVKLRFFAGLTTTRAADRTRGTD